MHSEDERNYLQNQAAGLEQGDTEGELGHGTKVIRYLVSPWINAPGDPRTVCEDSYFASVATAIELKICGVNFIGMVKTTTKQYPMIYLQNLELGGRGKYKVVASFNNHRLAELLAVLWVDRERRYFISNTEGVSSGEPQYRRRRRQAEDDPFAESTKKEIEIPQPKMIETYYSVASKIDQHNKQCQNHLELECYVCTYQWWKRV